MYYWEYNSLLLIILYFNKARFTCSARFFNSHFNFDNNITTIKKTFLKLYPNVNVKLTKKSEFMSRKFSFLKDTLAEISSFFIKKI